MSIHWLNVPFTEKDTAQSLGCRWDAHYRKWWKPQAVDIELIPTHWLITPSPKKGQRWKTRILN